MPSPCLLAVGDDRKREAAALRNHRDRPPAQVRIAKAGAEAREHALRQREHADAVRPDDAHAGALDRRLELRLKRRAFLADLPEARAQQDREADAGLAARLERGRNTRSGQRDDREVARDPAVDLTSG